MKLYLYLNSLLSFKCKGCESLNLLKLLGSAKKVINLEGKVLVANCYEEGLSLSKLISNYLTFYGAKVDLAPESTLNEVRFSLERKFYNSVIALTERKIFTFNKGRKIKPIKLARWNEIPELNLNRDLRKNYLSVIGGLFEGKIKPNIKILLAGDKNLINLASLLLNPLLKKFITIYTKEFDEGLILKALRSSHCDYGFFMDERGEVPLIFNKKGERVRVDEFFTNYKGVKVCNGKVFYLPFSNYPDSLVTLLLALVKLS